MDSVEQMEYVQRCAFLAMMQVQQVRVGFTPDLEINVIGYPKHVGCTGNDHFLKRQAADVPDVGVSAVVRSNPNFHSNLMCPLASASLVGWVAE